MSLPEACGITEHLAGERSARDLLDALRVTLGDGDELYRVVKRLQTDDALCGFLRVLQKSIERASRV
jgi:hypothetical protein